MGTGGELADRGPVVHHPDPVGRRYERRRSGATRLTKICRLRPETFLPASKPFSRGISFARALLLKGEAPITGAPQCVQRDSKLERCPEQLETLLRAIDSSLGSRSIKKRFIVVKHLRQSEL